MFATAALLLALCAAPATGQQPAPEPPALDDPERLRALASRTQPWPLRDHLPKPAPDMFVMPRPGCEPGEGLPVVIGQARLRLPGFTFVVPPLPNRPGDGTELQRHLRAMPEAEFCRGPSPADWAAATRLRAAYLQLTFLATDALDPRCHRPGLPGDPRPECDRPRDSRWWKAFALGLPLDITLQEPDARVPDGEPVSFGARALWSVPGRTLEPRPAGGWTIRDAAGLARGVVLPRPRGDDDTREPLIPDCVLPGAAMGDGWRPPGTPEEEARLPRAWTRCEVRYRHRGAVDVFYRFYREVFDEPDIPALDLRVRRLVQRMLDGADAPPPETPGR